MKKINTILVLVMVIGVNLGDACLTCKGPFPGPSGSIFSSKPASLITSHGRPTKVPLVHITGAVTEATASYQPLPTNLPGPTGSIHIGKPAIGDSAPSGESYQSSSFGHVLPSLLAMFPGPSGTIHDSKPVGASAGTAGASVGSQNPDSASSILLPSSCDYTPGSQNKNCGKSSSGFLPRNRTSGVLPIFPGPSGSIYNSKPHVSTHTGSVPSIHPQAPTGTYYIDKPLTPSKEIEAPYISPSFSGQIPCSDIGCGSKTSNKDNLNHEAAYQSGGIVYENEDGTYNNVPVTIKPIYKNSDQGGYAVSTDEADNSGVIVGPGTGHLPVESDAKLFGTQGAFGGSATFAKGAVQAENKSFGTQVFGNSVTFVTASTTAQTSGSFTSASTSTHVGSFVQSF